MFRKQDVIGKQKLQDENITNKVQKTKMNKASTVSGKSLSLKRRAGCTLPTMNCYLKNG